MKPTKSTAVQATASHPLSPISDFSWFVNVTSGGTLEFLSHTMECLEEPIFPDETIFSQIFGIIRDMEIDEDATSENIYIRCGGVIYQWDFILANHCFAKAKISETQFKEMLSIVDNTVR